MEASALEALADARARAAEDGSASGGQGDAHGRAQTGGKGGVSLGLNAYGEDGGGGGGELRPLWGAKEGTFGWTPLHLAAVGGTVH